MNNIAKKAIEHYYIDAKHSYYLEKCHQNLDFAGGIESSLKDIDSNISEQSPQLIWPSKDWLIDYDEFTENSFNASFLTRLKISKLAPLFYVQHEFSVLNRVHPRIEPTLDGYSGMPYTMDQYNFQEKISKFLKEKDYIQLTYSEMYEVIPELSFPKNVTIFGSQVTVEYALFHDLLDLCPEDAES
jgi:hypothetical protein